jgi:ATP synthase protein I
VKNQNQKGVQRLLFVQFCVTVLLACGALCVDKVAAVSALLGGLVCVIPNVYFARTLFKHQGARSARKIVNGFYAGEAYKLVLTVALFAMVFKTMMVNPLVFFLAYVVTQLVFWFAPLIINNKLK